MFETATTSAQRDAIARAHSERAAVFALGLAYIRDFFVSPRRDCSAPAALAHSAA